LKDHVCMLNSTISYSWCCFLKWFSLCTTISTNKNKQASMYFRAQ
jgi:hypothetical protein